MISRAGRRQLIDKFHRGFVFAMMGVTCAALTSIGFSMYSMIQDAKKKEKIMLAELQSGDDAEEFPSSPSSPVPR